jgi:hypothetical protein
MTYFFASVGMLILGYFVYVNGSYAKDGGYMNEMIDIGFENDSAGQGGSMWQWSDGYYQYGGRFKFDLKKIRR